MTPLEERLHQALTARADLVSHETVYPARPPAPTRSHPRRLATTAAVLAAAAAAVVATLTLTNFGRPSSASNPAGSGPPSVALTSSSAPTSSSSTTTAPSTLQTQTATDSVRTSEPVHLPGNLQVGPTRSSTTTGLAILPAKVAVRPVKGPAGSVVSFLGSCPLRTSADGTGAVSSKAFLQDADHQVDGVGGQTFAVHKDGTFAGSVAVPPDVPAGQYDVSLRCGKTVKPQVKTLLIVLPTQQPATDATLMIAAHAVYPGEWLAFSGVCQDAPPASGWVISPAFEDRAGHDYAGVAAVPFSTDSQGIFVGSAHIPADHPAGQYKVTVRCNGANLGVMESLDVLAP